MKQDCRYTGNVNYCRLTVITVVFFLVWISLSACSVKSVLDISADNSAILQTQLSVGGIALEYMSDLKSAAGDGTADEQIFFPDEVRSYFEILPGADPLEVSVDDVGEITVSLSFADIPGFFTSGNGYGIPDILTVRPEGRYKRLDITFHRDNMHQLAELLPMGEDPVSRSTLMLFEEQGSRDEFEEMMVWLFEEYASSDVILKSLHEARFDLEIRLPGDVIDTDMKRVHRTAVAVSVPMIDLFTLESPLTFFAVY